MLVLIGSGSNPIVTTASNSQTLYNGIMAINRLLFTICRKLPASNFGTLTTVQQCFDVVVLTYMGSGSLIVNSLIVGGSFESPDAASSSISSSFSNAKLDGV